MSFQVSNLLRFPFRQLFRSQLGRGAILGGLGVVLGDLRAVLGALGAVCGRSWALLGGLGALLGRSWGALGGSWGDFGRSKIDPKIVPKLDRKTGRIATEKNRSGATPVDVQSLTKISANQMTAPKKVIKTIYLSIY